MSKATIEQIARLEAYLEKLKEECKLVESRIEEKINKLNSRRIVKIGLLARLGSFWVGWALVKPEQTSMH